MNLFQKSIDMSRIYRENPKLEAIILAGSVSRNLEDVHSDIELHILRSASLTDDDRKIPIERVKGTILSYEPYEEGEWSESFIDQDGVKFEISNFLSTTVERFISDVVDRFETDYDKQCIVAAFNDGVSLYGKGKINELKNIVAKYPLGLSEKMISENLWLGNRWNNREALVYRQDWLMFYDVICDVQKKLFGVLFGLNHMYVHHPVFKWMKYNGEQMKIKPENLGRRITHILTGNPRSSVVELEILVNETIALVEKYIPELNISEQKQHIGFVK